MLSVKYVAKLEDGTVISKSPDEGLQFIAEEGMLHPVSLVTFTNRFTNEKAFFDDF